MSAQPTEEVTAFPFGEGVGAADGRGHCLPLWGEWRAAPREVSAFPFGESGTQPPEEVRFPLWGEWRAAPREVTAFPFYFYFNSATIATIIEIIEVNAANNPNK